jgi:ABC-type multidrug transport system fused ATPase/permease subunit
MSDIAELNLKELRSRLSMVVQESTLCSGTLRDALDISGEKGSLLCLTRTFNASG